MTTKATGAELKRFYNDAAWWPDGAWHEEETVTAGGEEFEGDYGALPDNAALTIEGGVVFADSSGHEELGSFEGYFKKWRKAQNSVFLSVEAPKDKLTEIKAAIKAAGGKVV